eukprot:scaffold576_cov146-Chaetoceros_neogracile.AAC.6
MYQYQNIHVLDDDDDISYNDDDSLMSEMMSETTTNYMEDSSRLNIIGVDRHNAAYQWKTFVPSMKNPKEIFKWLVTGFSEKSKLSDGEVEQNTMKLAHVLSLLREYEEIHGIPERGGPKEQLWVLTELCTRLYGSGTPLWVLKPAMSKVAEGLTGSRGADFVLFPRSATVYLPASLSTATFPMDRGFNIRTVSLMERILVRLSSFTSNTRAVHSVQARSPKVEEFIRAARVQSALSSHASTRRMDLAKEILDLASDGTGLFFLINEASKKYGGIVSSNINDSTPQDIMDIENFWTVEPSIREVFARLATIEAVASLDALDNLPSSSDMYPKFCIMLFRAISAIGASGLWFKASWEDMIFAGLLAIIVTLVEGSKLWKQERIIFEVIVSFVVGLLAGLVAHSWPEKTCFGAMAVAAVIDILQGFRVVYAIMEVRMLCAIYYALNHLIFVAQFILFNLQIMSKHTVSGGADLLEALLFTGLIAYFLRFGLHASRSMLGASTSTINDPFNECLAPIDKSWYFLLVPLTSLSWAVLFKPNYRDLPLMTMHGILSYVVYWVVSTQTDNSGLATFAASMSVTASAGFLSRFTGRQALGDTITGLYVLLPGSYLAEGLFTSAGGPVTNVLDSGLLANLVTIAVTIGLGGWTGTMLCSPTILGTNNGLLSQFMKRRNGAKRDRSKIQGPKPIQPNRSMLLF